MLEVKNLYKSFGENQILKGISFEIKKGEVKTIIGSSGSGKSTLLRCINCLEKADSGKILFDGQEYDFETISNSEIQQIRKHTGFVFQNYNLFNNLNVIDNIQKPLMIAKNKSKQEAYDVAIHMLEKVGMLDKLNEFPSRLSGGQSQRVGIARALALQPDLLLLDEPTSSLDPVLVNDILKIIKSLAAENYTMLIVTHEMNFAKQISDEIIFIDQGKIVESGRPDVIFKNAHDIRTQQFINHFFEEI